MYSVVLMAALTSGGQAPSGHGAHDSYGSCYGSCYGNYGLEGYGNCAGGNYYTCTGGYGGCWTGCGWGMVYGSCAGAGFGCSGSLYPWDYSSTGCCGCAGYGGSPYFPTVPMYGAPAYAPPAYAPPAGPVGEPPAKAEPLPEPKKAPPESLAPTQARLIVEVPANAKVYIDDHAMKTSSQRRTYQTPELEPGQTYFYEVRVETERDGKTVATSKRVLLKAGQEVRADFKDVDATVTAKAK